MSLRKPTPKQRIRDVPPEDKDVARAITIAYEGYGRTWGGKRFSERRRRRRARIMQLRIYVFPTTGCRVSEAVALKRADYDLVRKTVFIHEADTKSGDPKRGSIRTVGLSDDVVKSYALIFRELGWKPPPDPTSEIYILSGKFKRVRTNEIRKTFKKVAKAAGIPPDDFYPLILRKAFGTKLYDISGKDSVKVAEVLGHAEKKLGTTVEASYVRHRLSQQFGDTRRAQDELVPKMEDGTEEEEKEDENQTIEEDAEKERKEAQKEELKKIGQQLDDAVKAEDDKDDLPPPPPPPP